MSDKDALRPDKDTAKATVDAAWRAFVTPDRETVS